MDAFSYLSVLLSIILGLGMTQLLTAAGRIIRHRDRVRMDWLPLVSAGVLGVAYVQVWWAMFGLRGVQEWTFIRFFAVLAQVTTLYMTAAVALPEQVDEAGVDLREYFERQHRWFYAFLLMTLLISIIKDVLLSGHPPGTTNLVFHVVLITACLTGMLMPQRRVQEMLCVVFGGTMLVYIGELFTRLQ
jgi:hypothetical protein